MIWSIAEDGTDLAINAMPLSCLYSGMTSIPIHFQCGYNNDYTLTFSGMETFEFPTEFWLEDLNSEADWVSVSRDTDTYSFEGLVSDSAINRFVMHFLDPTGTNDNIFDSDAEKLKIFTANSNVMIENTSDEIVNEVAIYTITGQQIMRSPVANQSGYKFKVPDYTGYLIIYVSTNKQNYTQKILITK